MAKPRTGIPDAPGLSKVVNRSAWGEQKATERYGGGTRTFPPPSDQPQKPQDPVNKHGPQYDNDVANNWLRGAGQSAEGKPGFDSRGKDGAPKKW
jgi:hypothetical protein